MSEQVTFAGFEAPHEKELAASEAERPAAKKDIEQYR